MLVKNDLNEVLERDTQLVFAMLRVMLSTSDPQKAHKLEPTIPILFNFRTCL